MNLVHVNEAGSQQVIKKRVHLSLAVHKLMTIARRVFNLNAEKMDLVRVSSKVEFHCWRENFQLLFS